MFPLFFVYENNNRQQFTARILSLLGNDCAVDFVAERGNETEYLLCHHAGSVLGFPGRQGWNQSRFGI